LKLMVWLAGSVETAACISRHLSGRLAQTIQPRSLRASFHSEALEFSFMRRMILSYLHALLAWFIIETGYSNWIKCWWPGHADQSSRDEADCWLMFGPFDERSRVFQSRNKHGVEGPLTLAQDRWGID
jgi:hypothetical protein